MYCLKLLYEKYIQFFEVNCDPRSSEKFLMNSPIPIIVFIILYLKFVTKWGPQYMKNRPAYNLDKIMIVYNIIQVIWNLKLVIDGLTYTYGFGGYSLICEPVDTSYSEIALKIVDGCHDYVMIKLFDCLDTVFFILRKKEKQITFLHIYHHAGILALAWSACKIYPGGQSISPGLLNSLVHVVMYSYYLYALINRNSKNIWWKKYLTQLQIVQFCLIILHFTALLLGPDCGYPKWTVIYVIPQNAFMCVMFSDFYIKAYIKKKN